MLRFSLADRGIVTFPPGDTVRLYMSRKYFRDGVDDLLNASSLRRIKSADSSFVGHRSSPPFGTDLLLLERSTDGRQQRGGRRALAASVTGRLSQVIARLTVTLLACSFAISTYRFFKASPGINKFEPAVETLGLIGAILGVFLERQARRREVREQLFSSIAAELANNLAICQDPAFSPQQAASAGLRVYPRMRVSAVDAAFASGAAFELAHSELLNELHAWRDAAADFNRRLDLTELCAFTVGNAEERRGMHALLVSDDGIFSRLRAQLSTLIEHIRTAGEGIEEVARELAAAPVG